MSTAISLGESSEPLSFQEPLDTLADSLFRIASVLTDPICKSHEWRWRVSLVEEGGTVAAVAQKVFLLAGSLLFAGVALFTTLPGIALRMIAARLQSRPYLEYRGEGEEKTLGADRSFTLLSWNACCVAAAYPVTDGGVAPWSDRIDPIAQKILDADADLNCIYETFDLKSALALYEKLRGNYAHFYFNIGPKGMGVSSGIFIASKYRIPECNFTRYPLESLVGRTKNAVKGVFSMDLGFATVHATHLQHSEEPEFPTSEEIAARRAQMKIVVDKIGALRARCAIVTGDLNLDDAEYDRSEWRHLFDKGELRYGEKKTWEGDSFCANLVGKRPSGPLNLDHTMALRGTVRSLRTDRLETGYDPKKYCPEALSDHAPLLSTIVL